MTRFLLRRAGQAVIVLLLVTVIVFVLLHLLPGGAARATLGTRATPQQLAHFNKVNGLDDPLWQQYVIWLKHLLQGDLGYSYRLNQSVASLIGERLPKTILLNVLALAIAVVIAIPIGLTQAVRRNGIFDYTATFLGFVFYSTPIFFLSLMLVLVFSLNLGWFPAQAPQASTVAGILAEPAGLVLPVASLVLLDIALFSRYMRSATLDNIVQDYVRTAFSKGAGSSRVLYRHILRNSLIPMVTIIGLSLPVLIAGSLVTEQVFNYPGMGLLFYQEAVTDDYPVLLGITLVVGFATVLGNLLADIGYAALDPRVRVS
ncbi:ABC transporter permease [Nocardioides panaciterrulae]|uniref:Peptide/nickel transport system permease protein n=1 Tax=Nocardioides panaciterrulae TaxID=661492 RepID=A0A7Y9E6K4_9ACTN|nr:ABC transporter permease [Nocardioides panaciterrulae]NYD41900.1 peptide/nickel transport system permease protein [Nocardioides panaciterrulae]